MQAIVNVTENWAIGRENRLLFPLKADLRRFKELTMGHAVVMGRRTLESLPGKKGLPGRRNLVLTTNPDFTAPGVEVVHTPLQAVFATGTEDFCIGGESVYRQMLPYVGTVHVTKINLAPSSDSYFQNLDRDPAWHCADCSPWMEEDGVSYCFCTYVRRSQEGV
jgi:dihydrofolate reductase